MSIREEMEDMRHSSDPEVPADLRWLAENVSDWKDDCYKFIGALGFKVDWQFNRPHNIHTYFTRAQWQAAEQRMDAIGQNGATGDHYEAPASKYHVQIKGQRVDVYDILSAYGVTNPADAHAIKKMLCPGQRGAKDGIQDRQEAIVSLQRAIELEQGR